MDKQQIIEALEHEKEDLMAKIASLDMTILTLRQSSNLNGHGTSSNSIAKYKGYNQAKSNKDKVAIIVREEGRFLHMRQIISIAQSLEPREDPKEVAKKTQQAVYALKAQEVLISIATNESNLNVFWGSPNWADDKGHIKPDYMYDEDQLSSNKKIAI